MKRSAAENDAAVFLFLSREIQTNGEDSFSRYVLMASLLVLPCVLM